MRPHTLQPTALVHEAWLRLARSPEWLGRPGAVDRNAFLGVAARAMRRILVDHARARRAAKRGADAAVGYLQAGARETDELGDMVAAAVKSGAGTPT